MKLLKSLKRIINRFSKKGVLSAKALGDLGENVAVKALEADGYRIAERNMKVYGREVDIIAVDDKTLVFVEVKTRRNRSFGEPLAAIDNKRRKRLRKAADLYVMKKKLRNVSIRFDAVTVDYTDRHDPEIKIIKNAF